MSARSHSLVILLLSSLLSISTARAAMIQFSASDFLKISVFSNVQTFSFTVDVAGALSAGTIYTNPDLNSVSYNVSGSLDSTPSGFRAFNLVRNIANNDFYLQGSSFSFEIAASADLSDGLQASELVADGEGRIFNFNAREFEQFPPRYHPPLFELFDDGTGRIQNSNNQGRPDEFNPDSGLTVDVDFGEEYITDLTFNPASLTLSEASAVVPIPSSVLLFGSAMALLAGIGRSRRTAS